MDRSEDWIEQAERDLKAAENSATAGYHEWTAFQAQQCAEKAAKALVQSLHGSVRGHSISDILRQLPSSVAVPQTLLDAALELDRVYVASRYPNGFATGSPGDYFSQGTSRRLIAYARSLFDFCRSQIH